MACKNCSEIRCKVYGKVSGQKTRFVEGYYCGNGQACEVQHDKAYFGKIEHAFGSSWKSFRPFLKVLFKAAVDRLRGKPVSTNVISLMQYER